ncbi:MAG: hypothetical protein GWM90_06865, partial [Gemmatimonadetes bacterium]|nr:hypothetical protein [Gemmatimonadota bacterium]NIQ53517.1 hypothetical protein [Gemmatimonadota bacterium]NIU73659.1 hypothetical protein [Gammaproteobacteria bacterium]NIX43837.1 hypothetical protein [Gemmatimonadota bacterium]NIY08041.1 hypothetical protein [Gemmatimonadota bacterium]
GQEPDSRAPTPDPFAAPTQDTLAAPAPPPPPAPRFSLAVTVGTAGLGEIQSQPVRALRTDAGGAPLDTAILKRVLSVDGGLHAGASAIVSLTPVWAVRIGAGLTRASLRPEYEGEEELFVTTVRAVSDAESVDLRVLSLESALRFRLPTTRRLRPYLELGAVATRWRTDAALMGVPGLEDGVTRLGVTAALGGVLPLGSVASLRLRATTGAVRTPVEPARGALAIPSSTLALSFEDPDGPP